MIQTQIKNLIRKVENYPTLWNSQYIRTVRKYLNIKKEEISPLGTVEFALNPPPLLNTHPLLRADFEVVVFSFFQNHPTKVDLKKTA